MSKFASKMMKLIDSHNEEIAGAIEEIIAKYAQRGSCTPNPKEDWVGFVIIAGSGEETGTLSKQYEISAELIVRLSK